MQNFLIRVLINAVALWAAAGLISGISFGDEDEWTKKVVTIVLVALVPVNLTLTVFNYTELVGHLPIYGVLAVLLIWEPGQKNLSLWLRGLREGPRASLSTEGNNA